MLLNQNIIIVSFCIHFIRIYIFAKDCECYDPCTHTDLSLKPGNCSPPISFPYLAPSQSCERRQLLRSAPSPPNEPWAAENISSRGDDGPKLDPVKLKLQQLAPLLAAEGSDARAHVGRCQAAVFAFEALRVHELAWDWGRQLESGFLV